MKRFHLYLFLLLIIRSTSSAQVLMTPEQRDEFLADMVLSFQEEFLWTEKGKEIAEKLQLKIENGDYAQYKDAELFTSTFTRDLFVLSSDRHLTVGLKPNEQKPGITNPEKDNTSAFNLEKLDNGVYYLKFDVFPSLKKDLETDIDRMMSSMNEPESIIIDLRDNYGGSDQTVNFLAGYFFRDETKLAVSYQWGQEDQEIWAKPKTASEVIAKANLIILTSEATFSAAEIFTQRLQLHNKATVIGEQTTGGAHRSAAYIMNDIFLLNWPYEKSEHAVNKQDLEGKGIKPDIYAHYNNAKKTALDFLKSKGNNHTRAFELPTEPQFLTTFIEQLNSEDVDEAFNSYLVPKNKNKVLRTLTRFKTVWNKDVNATVSNVQYLEDGNVRLVVNTAFGKVFIKLIVTEGQIGNLLYRL